MFERLLDMDLIKVQDGFYNENILFTDPTELMELFEAKEEA